ncbi:hypothetical protein RUND412_002992 [Rhizina undulata]
MVLELKLTYLLPRPSNRTCLQDELVAKIQNYIVEADGTTDFGKIDGFDKLEEGGETQEPVKQALLRGVVATKEEDRERLGMVKSGKLVPVDKEKVAWDLRKSQRKAKAQHFKRLV